jgi:hypothetical protein
MPMPNRFDSFHASLSAGGIDPEALKVFGEQHSAALWN